MMKRLLLALFLFVVVALPALALTPGQKLLLFSGGWWAQGSAADWDFANNRSYIGGVPGAGTAGLTLTRTTVGYAQSLNGIWTQFASGQFRVTDKGLLIEEQRTNNALWARDFTNAAWVKTTMTAALTATGIDGTANSASTLTATAGNATALQTVVLGSAAYDASFWLRRVSGSGTIQIVLDGVTFTTAAVTTTWTQFQVTATVLNPVIGIRIVTNGDVIEADFGQLESGAFATSPILTTTVAATRNGDGVQFNNTALFLTPAATLVALITAKPDQVSGVPRIVGTNNAITPLFVDAPAVAAAAAFNGSVQLNSGGTTNWLTAPRKAGSAWDGAGRSIVVAGGAVGTDANLIYGGSTPSAFYLGSSAGSNNVLDAYVSRLTLWSFRKSNTELQALTQ